MTVTGCFNRGSPKRSELTEELREKKQTSVKSHRLCKHDWPVERDEHSLLV